MVTNHALNVTGGSEFSKFSTGIGYQYQDGAFGGPVKTDYRRFTFRINSEHVIYRKGDVDVIKFGENIYYQHKQNQGVQLGNQYSNDLSNALRAIPLIPVYNENGDFFMYDDLKNFGTSANGILDYTAYASNPMAHMVYNQAGNNKNKNFNLNTAAYLEVQPLKNLIYKGQVSYKQWSSSWRSYLPVYQINNQGDSRDKDQTINNVSLGWNWSLTNTLSYRFDITDLHHFDVLAGTEYSKSRPTYGESVEATGYNSAFGDFTHAYLHNTERKATATVNGYPSDYGSKMSYFGRLNYDFKETYMFSAIIRADGSSKFAKGNQWGYFPSFSAGWVISNEAFMKNTASWLGFLKVRAGWGQNGNDNIPNSNWRAGYEFGDYGLYTFGSDKNGGTTGAYPNRLANPDLTWETSEQTNIGIDARFLNSRLTVTADYFHKKTKDLIVSGIKASTVVGNSFSPVNAGNITNKGFELELGWQDRIGDFAYGVRANVATLKNKVTKMHESLSSIDGATYVTYGAITRFEVGKPAWYFYGYDFMGVDSKTGEPIFRDIDGVEGITDNDKTEIGKGIADYTYGITLNAAWKGFDFILFGTGSQGNDVFCGLNRVDYNLNQLTYFTKNRWTESNRNGKTPASGATDYTKYLTSSGCVFDGSYFKIKQIQLGYSFPKQLIKKVAIENLRIYGSLEDFFTFTDYPGFDPEVTGVGNSLGVDKGSYPNSKKVVLGLSVTF